MTVNKRGIEFLQDPALNINHAYRPECATQAPRNPNQQRTWHKVRLARVIKNLGKCQKVPYEYQ